MAASAENVPLEAVDISVPVEIVPPDERALQTLGEQSAEVAATAMDEEAPKDESKVGIKRSREDPEQHHEVVEEESGEKAVNKRIKPEGYNGDAGLNSVDEHEAEEKADSENAMDAQGEEKVDTPEDEDEVAGDAELDDEVEASTQEQESGDMAPMHLGPKVFNSGAHMFTYFYDLLHGWVTDLDLNKYEHLVLSDLIFKGHQDPEKKIGAGIKAFQIKKHPEWKSRCYYLVRTDGSSEDFSYRKCVDKLMPLPPSLFLPSGALNLDELLPLGRNGEKPGNGAKPKSTGNQQVGSKGSFRDKGRVGGGRRGGHRGRGRSHHRR